MSEYKKITCPICGKKLGSYRIDSSVQKNHGHCKCGSYTVTHGNNKIEFQKGCK